MPILFAWGMRCGTHCVVRFPFGYHCHLCALYEMCMSLDGLWLGDSQPPSDHDLVGKQRQFRAMQCLSTAGRSVEAVPLVSPRAALQGNISIQDISRCLARKNHIHVHGSAEHGVLSRYQSTGPRPGFIPSLWASDLESPMSHIAQSNE